MSSENVEDMGLVARKPDCLRGCSIPETQNGEIMHASSLDITQKALIIQHGCEGWYAP